MNRFSRSQNAILILVALLLLSLYGWRHYSGFRQSLQPERVLPVGVIVQVSGKVRAPGTYSFDREVTVSQAVIRAGGLHPSLRLEPREASLPVSHGRHVSVVADGKGIAHPRLGWMSVPNRLVLGVPVDVNLASAAELAQVPGISELLAERIVDQRNRLDGFSRLEDLRLVDGVGPVSLSRLRQYLTVSSNQPPAGRTE
jgi:competence protein ComEA